MLLTGRFCHWCEFMLEELTCAGCCASPTASFPLRKIYATAAPTKVTSPINPAITRYAVGVLKAIVVQVEDVAKAKAIPGFETGQGARGLEDQSTTQVLSDLLVQ